MPSAGDAGIITDAGRRAAKAAGLLDDAWFLRNPMRLYRVRPAYPKEPGTGALPGSYWAVVTRTLEERGEAWDGLVPSKPGDHLIATLHFVPPRPPPDTDTFAAALFLLVETRLDLGFRDVPAAALERLMAAG